MLKPFVKKGLKRKDAMKATSLLDRILIVLLCNFVYSCGNSSIKSPSETDFNDLPEFAAVSEDAEDTLSATNENSQETFLSQNINKLLIVGGITQGSTLRRKLSSQFSALIKYTSGGSSCTGFRLDDFRYATAAHCVSRLASGSSITIYRGISGTSGGWQGRIQAIHIHPNYSSGPSEDVYMPISDQAVIEVDFFLSQEKAERAVLCANNPPDGTRVTLAGYGAHQWDSSSSNSLSFISNVLLGDACQIWPSKTCDATERYLEKGSVWHGDSGGPAYWGSSRALVGVINGSNRVHDMIATISDRWLGKNGGKYYRCK